MLQPETLTKYNLPDNVASRQHGGNITDEGRATNVLQSMCLLVPRRELQCCECDQIVRRKNKSLLLILFILHKQVLCRKFENMTSSPLSSRQFHLISERTNSHLSVNMDNKSEEHVHFGKADVRNH